MSLQEFLVPDIGEGLADVEIVEWHVAVGDEVREHQLLVSVETDKSVIEMPSPFTGIVRELRGEAGDRIPVGALLAVFETAVASVLPPTGSPRESSAAPRSRPIAAASEPTDVPSGASPRPRASPAVRRLARELGVDLATVVPTGAGGLVVADDVHAAAGGDALPADRAAPVTAPSKPSRRDDRETVRTPLRGLRRTIARNMSAVALVPHITSHREVEVTALLDWRARVNERRGDRPLTLTPFLALCVMGALRAVPQLNATFDEEADEVAIHAAIHLGVATATDDGLLVPIVHDADRLGLDDLAAAIDTLGVAARERSLTPGQMSGGTFTITNYGSQGGWFGTPLLRIPEIGIAGFGRVASRPWVIDGSLGIGAVLPVSVSVDHRIIDGDVSGRFASALEAYLADPLRLLDVASAWS